MKRISTIMIGLTVTIIALLVALTGQASLRQRKVIVNGVEAQNPPFEYVDKGKIVGYDIDVAAAVAKRLGVEIKTVDTAWAGIIPALYNKKFDMIMSAMTVTEERMKQVNFVTPTASDQVIIFTRANGERVKKFSDLNGLVVGTQLNSATEQLLKEYAARHNVQFKQLRLYDHYMDAFLDMKNGNLDATASGIITGKLNFLPKFPGEFRIAVELPIYIYMAAAIRKDDTELYEAVNKALVDMKSSGELKALQLKWFGFEMYLPDKPVPPEIVE